MLCAVLCEVLSMATLSRVCLNELQDKKLTPESVGHFICDYVRGATSSRCNLLVAQAWYWNSFQLTHMPRGNHAQSIASNGGQREDKKLLQRSQLRQHGEFRHVSVSD